MNGKILKAICQLISGNNIIYMCVTRQQAEDLFKESKKIKVEGLGWCWPDLTIRYKNSTLRFCHNTGQLLGHRGYISVVDEVDILPKEVATELQRRAKNIDMD